MVKEEKNEIIYQIIVTIKGIVINLLVVVIFVIFLMNNSQ